MKGNSGRFCSQQCNGASKKGAGAGPRVTHEFNCAVCGKYCRVYRSPSAQNPVTCSVRCTGLNQRGSLNPSFTGGTHIGDNGYVRILRPTHPGADSRGYVYEHRLVMEEHLGRYLQPGEVVHHINRNKTDNRIDNLGLFASQSEHMKHHSSEVLK
ncbi:HNH endonuclease signature motif containing protein [Rhodococcus ruber]